MGERPEAVEHYAAYYRQFGAEVYEEVRRAAFGEDIGQNSWLTVGELEAFASRLAISASSRLLDVGCGSGGPALHLVRLTGCQVLGLDLDEAAVANGSRLAREAELDSQARFEQDDASQRLRLDDALFDAILCIDSIVHLAERAARFSDWARLLTRAGRLLFTDAGIVTGILGSDEIAIRTSIGYFVLVPPGENERLLTAAGLQLLAVEDTTELLADVARRRHEARAERAQALTQLEGEASFRGRQRFYDTVANLARERRLSRLVYLAEKPS